MKNCRNHVIEDIRKCADLGAPSRVPCLPLGCDFDVRQTPFTHREYRSDPDKMLELWKIVIDKFDYDWALLFPDDLIEWEFTGIEVSDDEWIPPGVVRHLEPTREALKSMRLPDPGKDGRMPLHLEGLRLINRHFGGSRCVTSRIAAPFTAVSLLLGVQESLMLMLEDPQLFRDWMEWAERCNDIWAQAQVEAGADALWIGDCIATSKFIPLSTFMDFAAEPADRSARMIDKLGALSFYHGNETRLDYFEAIAANISASAVNVGEGADIALVKAAIGGRKCIMGNLDPVSTLQQGTVNDVERETARVVNAGKPGGGYIFCTGEGIPHNTPPENVRACLQTVRRVGRYTCQ
jgi:uroporphyrinogen decarboxylase